MRVNANVLLCFQTRLKRDGKKCLFSIIIKQKLFLKTLHTLCNDCNNPKPAPSPLPNLHNQCICPGLVIEKPNYHKQYFQKPCFLGDVMQPAVIHQGTPIEIYWSLYCNNTCSLFISQNKRKKETLNFSVLSQKTQQSNVII